MTTPQNEWNDLGMRLETLDRHARAIITAGRPNTMWHTTLDGCDCAQCAAWDALAELLKTGRTAELMKETK